MGFSRAPIAVFFGADGRVALRCRRMRVVPMPFLRLLPLVVMLGQLPARSALRPVEEIAPGRTVSHILRGSDTHPYAVSAAAGDVLRVVVEQEGIDVRVAVFDGRRRMVCERDGFEFGRETLTWLVEHGGGYRVEVTAAQKGSAPGLYRITVSPPRPAQPNDAERARAEEMATSSKRKQAKGEPGDLAAALDQGREALLLWRRLEAAPEELWTMIRLGNLHHSLGEYEEALAGYEEALPLAQRIRDRRSEAEIQNDMGMALWQTDRPLEAVAALEKALILWKETGNAEGTSATSSNLGLLAWQTSDYQAALHFSLDALAQVRRLGNLHGEGFVHNNLGVIFSSLGEDRRALDEFQRAFSLFRESADLPAAARVMLLIGRGYLHLGRTGPALSWYGQALEQLGALQDRQWSVDATDGLAQTYQRLGRTQEALLRYRQALSEARKLGYSRGQANALYGLGTVLAASGHLEEAMADLSEARRLQIAIGLRDASIDTLRSMADIAMARNQPESARDLLLEAASSLEVLGATAGGDQFRATYLGRYHGVYQLLTEAWMMLHATSPGSGFDREALAASEQGRARGILGMLAARSGGASAPGPAEARERLSSLQRELSYISFQLARTMDSDSVRQRDLRERLNTLVAAFEDLERRDRTSADPAMPPPATIEAIQRAIPPGTMLLEYSLGKAHSYVWTIDSNSIRVTPLAARAVIERAARRVLPLLNTPPDRARAQAEAQLQPALARITDLVLRPIQERIAGQHLTIVSDGILFYLPFAALPSPVHPEAPLVVDHELDRLASASVLVALRQRPPAPPAEGTLAIFADPVFEATDGRVHQPAGGARMAGQAATPDPGIHLPRLVFSRKEADLLWSLVEPGTAFRALGFEASKTAVARAAGRFRVLHFATHTLVNAERPELSGIVLSLVDPKGQPADGFLQMQELSTLNMAGTDLVVLASCQSGLGRAVEGEGLVGLSQALLRAGAGGVLVSLWPVSDEATARLMVRFHRGTLGSRPASPPAALRAAQVAAWRNQRTRHPYYWGAWTVEGFWPDTALPGHGK
jgi:CHAT domain-containing protein/tetratricopeptide (TPR) repeat protein